MSESAGPVREAIIERVVPGGDSLARLNGVVTLVPGGLPGDRVNLRIRREGPRLLRGEILELLGRSADRRPDEDLCPRAREGSCGGCDWPAARLESHRALKAELVLDAFRRIGRLSEEEIPEARWIGSPRNYRLRNRFHFDRNGRLGFFAPRSNRVSDLTTCEIVSKKLLERLPAIKAAIKDLGATEGELSTLEDREGKTLIGEFRLARGELSAASKGRGGDFAASMSGFDGFRVVDPSGAVLFEEGPSSLEIVASGATFRVSVSSFFQGNRFLLDVFLDETRSALRGALRGEENCIDLYAGVGFLTRPLLEAARDASKGRKPGEVVAVEVDSSSFSDLSGNLLRWESEGRGRAHAIPSTAEAFLSSLFRQRPVPPVALVVADPPRAGLSAEVRRHLLRLSPRSILLVSCDPPTLARDLQALSSAYRLERLVLLDLFPQTHHVETMVLLAGKGVG